MKEMKMGGKTFWYEKVMKKIQCDLTQKLSNDLGFDIDKLEAEGKRLKAEGKTAEEVRDILKPRMEEFKRADAKKEGGEW